MRYKDLLTIVFVVATASWIWAEPSQEVKVPTRPLAVQESQPLQKQTPPKPDVEEPLPETKPVSWSDLTESDFALEVSVEPGEDFKSTTFEVTFRGPEGYDMIKDGTYGQANFQVRLGSDQYLFTDQAERVGDNRWRFRGADLSSEKPPVIDSQTTFRVTTMLRDHRQSRYSRGANMMVLESQPAQLSLR